MKKIIKKKFPFFLSRWTILLLYVWLTPLAWAKPTAQENPQSAIDPFWQNAIVYFLMTDRFANGDTGNDHNFGRVQDGAVLRNFMGGDIKGVIEKIEAGYFDALGVDVLWLTPLNEQIHGAWDDEWGRSYPFHGYWPKDWTKVDPNFGTESEMKHMINVAHKHGMRVLADVIINHTGPKTPVDLQWPNDWVRTEPLCQWHSYAGNVQCALAPSLTDLRTESESAVELPPFLLEKWRNEGRLAQELSELDAFFNRTKLVRAPKNYTIKWLTDWVREYGIDGFRVDTAKHVEAGVWQRLKTEASLAFEQWKTNNPSLVLDTKPFFMVGEVMHFGVNGFKNTVDGTRKYDYGDRQVDFYAYGFDSLINMGFATHASGTMEKIFSTYSRELNQGPLSGVGILNYVVSHDDPEPHDKEHSTPYETALKLMLAPGAAQIYYGDELARNLIIEGAVGDAAWRSFMPWQDIAKPETQKLLQHWQKLGMFRHHHLAIGAGIHHKHNDQPYIFSRTLKTSEHADQVLVAIGMNKGRKTVPIYGVFSDGTLLKDYYSGSQVEVRNGKVALDTDFELVLLGQLSREEI